MNARIYRTKLTVSPLDFPPIMGLGQTSVSYRTEAPQIIYKKILLTITMKHILTDMGTNKEHEVLTAKSMYEIPTNEIKSREDVYEFYKDATVGLNEAFQYGAARMPLLPRITFPNQPIEKYEAEIDRFFHLLESRN